MRARLIKICNYGLINDLKKSCELTSACLKRPRSFTTALLHSNLGDELSSSVCLSSLLSATPFLHPPSHCLPPLLHSYASSLPRSCLVPVRQPLRPSHLDQLRWEGKIETCDGWMRTFECDKVCTRAYDSCIFMHILRSILFYNASQCFSKSIN